MWRRFLGLFGSGRLGPAPIRPLWYGVQESTFGRVMWPEDASVWVGPFIVHGPGYPQGERGKDWETDADEVHQINDYTIFWYGEKGEDWRKRDAAIRAQLAEGGRDDGYPHIPVLRTCQQAI